MRYGSQTGPPQSFARALPAAASTAWSAGRPIALRSNARADPRRRITSSYPHLSPEGEGPPLSRRQRMTSPAEANDVASCTSLISG